MPETLPPDRPKSSQDLPRLSQSVSFIYAENSSITRKDQTVEIVDEDGRMALPVASITALLLGPGTSVTHKAMSTLADHGCSVTWLGQNGVRMYAAARPENRSSRLAERQATAWAHATTRKRIARRLYLTRFPGENVAKLSIAQLRGREGARVREAYKRASTVFGVDWGGRIYDPNDWSVSDPVNKALSTATSCLYGVCHGAIVTLGLIPSLGFIHTGHYLSFVYDIADLYKAELAVPAAFQAVADHETGLDRVVRLRLRDYFGRTQFLKRVSNDLVALFAEESDGDVIERLQRGRDQIRLWDPDEGEVAAGANYGDAPWSS